MVVVGFTPEPVYGPTPRYWPCFSTPGFLSFYSLQEVGSVTRDWRSLPTCDSDPGGLAVDPQEGAVEQQGGGVALKED